MWQLALRIRENIRIGQHYRVLFLANLPSSNMETTTWGLVMASETLLHMVSASSARAHDHPLPAGLDHLDLVISSSSLRAHLCLNLCKWRWKKYNENYTVLWLSPKPRILRRAWTSMCQRDLPTISTVRFCQSHPRRIKIIWCRG